MITIIAPGDLVLRDGRAEEVTLTFVGDASGMRYASTNGCAHYAEDLTRIGSTLPPENWRVHTGSERPEGVGAYDIVEVWTDMTVKREAGDFDWGDRNLIRRGKGRILAYRIVSRAKPSMDAKAASMDAPRQVPASELRAVAEEMRTCFRSEPVGHVIAKMPTWADRIDPPNPEPPKVGDWIAYGGDRWAIIALFGYRAWIKNALGEDKIAQVEELERIP